MKRNSIESYYLRCTRLVANNVVNHIGYAVGVSLVNDHYNYDNSDQLHLQLSIFDHNAKHDGEDSLKFYKDICEWDTPSTRRATFQEFKNMIENL